MIMSYYHKLSIFYCIKSLEEELYAIIHDY